MKSNRVIVGMAFFFVVQLSLAQKIRGTSRYFMPRDKIELNNGDVETGKIIRYDSTKVRVQKTDYSEKSILWSEIDTIKGLSHFTWFLAPSAGFTHWDGLISQRSDTFPRDAFSIQMKAGYMRKKRFAANAALAFEAGGKHALWHLGVGIRRYIFSNYVNKRSFYVGLNFGYNFPMTNMNRFFDLGWCMGYEYWLLEKYRLFLEYENYTSQKYTPPPKSNSFKAGARISIEYKKHYRKVNQFNPNH